MLSSTIRDKNKRTMVNDNLCWVKVKAHLYRSWCKSLGVVCRLGIKQVATKQPQVYPRVELEARTHILCIEQRFTQTPHCTIIINSRGEFLVVINSETPRTYVRWLISLPWWKLFYGINNHRTITCLFY